MTENSLEFPDANDVLNRFFEIDELRLTRKDREFIVAQIRAQREVFIQQEAAGVRKRTKTATAKPVPQDTNALMDQLKHLMGVPEDDQ